MIGMFLHEFFTFQRRQFLLRLPLMLPADYDSPICREWPTCPPKLLEASILLRRIHHKWRVCQII